jgi:hypothetical protein
MTGVKMRPFCMRCWQPCDSSYRLDPGAGFCDRRDGPRRGTIQLCDGDRAKSGASLASGKVAIRQPNYSDRNAAATASMGSPSLDHGHASNAQSD